MMNRNALLAGGVRSEKGWEEERGWQCRWFLIICWLNLSQEDSKRSVFPSQVEENRLWVWSSLGHLNTGWRAAERKVPFKDRHDVLPKGCKENFKVNLTSRWKTVQTLRSEKPSSGFCTRGAVRPEDIYHQERCQKSCRPSLFIMYLCIYGWMYVRTWAVNSSDSSSCE